MEFHEIEENGVKSRTRYIVAVLCLKVLINSGPIRKMGQHTL